jgi:hypothetical protein
MNRLHMALAALAVLFTATVGTSAAGWFRAALPCAVAAIGLLVWLVGDLVMTELQQPVDEGRYTGVDR